MSEKEEGNNNNNSNNTRRPAVMVGSSKGDGGVSGGGVSGGVSQRAMGVASFKVMDVLRRANELQKSGHDILHCEVGQPETGAPTIVANAAVQALSNDDDNKNPMGYTDAFGLHELRTNIAKHYRTKYNNSLTKDIPISRIVITTGSSGAFLLAFTSCFDVGDVVAVASSGYPCYRNILNSLGIDVCTIPINKKSYQLTSQELVQEIQRRRINNEPPIKGLILSSPSNPTGVMLSPEQLQALCQVSEQYDIQFISDEIYHGISYGQVPEATALQFSNNVMVINSFSKYYSMSGWRLGWMVLPENERLIDAINTLQQNMFINAPTISQTAALQCWTDECIEELEGHVQKYKQSRGIILEALAKLRPQLYSIAPADGGFYVYVDLGDDNVVLPSWGSVRFCECLLEEKYVAFTPGIDFEDPTTDLGNRRFRISYSQGVAVAQNAMKRFQEFWPTWIDRVRDAR